MALASSSLRRLYSCCCCLVCFLSVSVWMQRAMENVSGLVRQSLCSKLVCDLPISWRYFFSISAPVPVVLDCVGPKKQREREIAHNCGQR